MNEPLARHHSMMTGELRIIRLYLPADKSPVEIASIQYTGKTGTFKVWSFTSAKP